MSGSGEGKPGELSPRATARDLGIRVPSGPLALYEKGVPNLLDIVVLTYWERRVPITKAELRVWRRERDRRTLTARQWLRRAGAA